MKQSIFVEDHFLGECEAPAPQFVGGDLLSPLSVAYFCPGCGRIWARRCIAGKSWTTTQRPCRTCGPRANPFFPPQYVGSLLDNPAWLFAFTDPPDFLLPWEAESLALNLERELNA
jgi:predicted RNA-binding Zn-ribbon protein involved in translation (DUF1610 family)